jgi:membrane-bound metal-dependent hydrolase YbcI (DUF457 family)
MTGKTHLSGGIAAAITIERTASLSGFPLLQSGQTANLLGLSASVAMLAFVAAAFGSLLPDLDEPNSLVSNLPRASRGLVRGSLRKRGVEGAIRFLVEFVLLMVNFLTRALSKLVRSVSFGHRGATHWLITALVVGVIGVISGTFIGFPGLGLWLFIGYVSHLALDSMTISGLKLLQPLTGRTIHLLPKPMRIRTGSIVDRMLLVCFMGIAAVGIFDFMAASLHPEQIRELWYRLTWWL